MDAEQTAQNVSLSNRFPLKFPPLALTTGTIFSFGVFDGGIHATPALVRQCPAGGD